MTSQKRIHELTTRQIYYGSSMVVKLNSQDGKWYYRVYAWVCDSETRMLLDKSKVRVKAGISKKYRVIQGKYTGQDPHELIELAQKELSVKKIKCGVPIPDTSQRSLT